MKINPYLLIAWLFLALTSASAVAAPPVLIDVNGYSAVAPIRGERYTLVPNENVRENEMEWIEFSNHIARALTTKGLVRTANPASADIIILVSYGIGNPKRIAGSYSLPVYGQNGVSSSDTSGHVNAIGQISATTTYMPSYGQTGSFAVPYAYDTYDRWLRLDGMKAHTVAANKQGEELWRTEIKSSGTSGDLRYIFPMMAFAASPLIGADTGKAQRVKLKENAKEYRAFLATTPAIEK